MTQQMLIWAGVYGLAGLAGVLTLIWLVGVRYIPHNRVGIVEKFWSSRGSLTHGRIVSRNGEAGFQAQVLRGGVHFFYPPFQYRIHRTPLVAVAEGRIGYVYARDGVALEPTQTLGRVIPCHNYQDAVGFLDREGQRGRQRGILREGVYAINLAQFVVITEDCLYQGPAHDGHPRRYENWREELAQVGGFWPVVVGRGSTNLERNAESDLGEKIELAPHDTIGIITVHDGPPLDSGEIIAPEVPDGEEDPRSHGCFQDPEKFLELGGRRGKQLQVLTDGTFFINRWFATVEIAPKTMAPIGYVGVIVSYYGVKGEDVTGENFRYGEQVERGHRGVWKYALPPGKYPLNPFALTMELAPTTNIVLRWITGRVESHNYDRDPRSIELITADGYEPTLPLSLVLHIDYQNAPRVVQRFGNVHRLINQTLDPILSAYFRDVAQDSHMLDLLTKREQIQKIATDELGTRFSAYDINCVAVLIGRPESRGDQYQPGEDLIERLFDQLRVRRHAEEQLTTYAKQEDAAKKLKELNDAQATAEKQSELTQTRIDIEIAGNKGDAKLSESRRLAEREVVMADAQAKARELAGKGEGRARELQGQGEAMAISAKGLAEAEVFLRKVEAYGDPRLFALHGLAQNLANCTQPLAPERMMLMGGQDGANGSGPAGSGSFGLFNHLIALLLAEKSGLGLTGLSEPAPAPAPEPEPHVASIPESQPAPMPVPPLTPIPTPAKVMPLRRSMTSKTDLRVA